MDGLRNYENTSKCCGEDDKKLSFFFSLNFRISKMNTKRNHDSHFLLNVSFERQPNTYFFVLFYSMLKIY